jgi:hypothetical protein
MSTGNFNKYAIVISQCMFTELDRGQSEKRCFFLPTMHIFARLKKNY